MDQIEEIKRKLDIVEFINKYTSLTKLGRNFKANCPFHSEKTPSFVVSPERQIWHCFGACNEGGDIFKFLMKWDNISFYEAAQILAEEAGIKLEISKTKDNTFNQKSRIYTINQIAADFYAYLLNEHKIGEKARQYLKLRGVSEKTTNHFQLGYSPNSWDSLLKYLLKKGYNSQEILDSGLGVKSGGGRVYDRFRSRIMFPLNTSRGEVIGFGGRTLIKSQKEAKYINTPETLVYKKREHLYGLQFAQNKIREKKEVIVMEGEFDAILAHQNGYDNTVAIKGSALTNYHLKFLRRISEVIIFALDMDVAGSEAVKRGIVEAEKFDFQMEVIQLEGNKDPADVFLNDPLIFKKAYKKRSTIYDFLINSSQKNHDSKTAYGKKRVAEEVMPYLYKIKNPIVQDYYLKQLANQCDIPFDSLKRSMFLLERKISSKDINSRKTTTKEKTPIWQMLEEHLVALLVQANSPKIFFSLIDKYLTNEDFHSPSTFKIIKIAKNSFVINGVNYLEELEKEIPKELVEQYNKAYLLEFKKLDNNWQKEIKKTILSIKKHSLKKQIQNLMSSANEKDLNNKMIQLKEVDKSLSIL
jgi:DNA primase